MLTKIRASGADLVYLGGVIETGAQVIIRQMKEVGLVAPRTRFMGPDGLLEEELLKGATCDAALATEMRVTFAGLPFEKMSGVGRQDLRDLQDEVRQGADLLRALRRRGRRA